MVFQRYILAALATAQAVAAATGGSIAGTVSDPSGGLMPDVVVAARNMDTGVARSATTNADGFYAFPALPEGQYELGVEHAGFQAYRSAGVQVESDAALRADIRLLLEKHDEAVTVTESATRVETTATQMGN
ncbi:MAG TPA: carboxypeptidase-like regulatory domain-containing protein [Verrucomicrobiae bacterium]|nr:carboxypeptidase-like regulatory domain-containing protein [Verrucomicrobiae bacterium]